MKVKPGAVRLFIDGQQVSGKITRVAYAPTSASIAPVVDFGTVRPSANLRSTDDIVIETVRGIALPRFGYPIRLDVERRPYPSLKEYYFTLRSEAPERDHGERIPLMMTTSIPCATIEQSDAGPRWYVLEHVRRMLHAFVQHEIDECMMFGGDRVFDPHAGEFKGRW